MTLKLNLKGISLSANSETLKLGSTKYYKRKAGQLLYGKQNFFHGSLALIPKEADGYATSGDVPSLDVNNIDSKYLMTYIGRSTYYERKEAYSTGTGSKRIHEKTLLGFDITVPSPAEQKKIGKFLTGFDNLIVLHQRKLDHLEEQKKGFLQKMFPKKGQTVPEIRFPGFTDAWEQRKVGGLAERTFGGGTPKTSVEEYWNGDLPWIQSSDLILGDVLHEYSKKKISEEAIRNSAAKKIPAKSIAIVTRVGVGKLAFVDKSFSTSQDFLTLADLNGNINFTLYLLFNLLKKEGNKTQGTSIKGITKSELLARNISVPLNLNEQQKIGSFFKQLDSLIALHQRKLNHLKLLRKSLLQQVFI